MFKNLLLGICFLLSQTALAEKESGRSSYDSALASFTGGECQKKAKHISELRLLFGGKEFRTWFSSGQGPETFIFKGWSQDLLVKAILNIQTGMGTCAIPLRIAAALSVLRRGFLREVGVTAVEGFPDTEVDSLFRGLISRNDDASEIKAKLAGFKPHSKVDPVSEILRQVYGTDPKWVRGILVMASEPKSVEHLATLVGEICGAEAPCVFWNPKFLYRIMITGQEKIAAYVPEFALMILSRKLLDEPSVLDKIVLLHELTHVAERAELADSGKDWRSEFASFSGWQKDSAGHWDAKVTKLRVTRKDLLTELSMEGSEFSILPDPVYVGKTGFDGFVMGKSYLETLKRQDVSEDLADHVAVFKFFPRRYCWNGKAVAPAKFKWVNRTFFGDTAKSDCP